jgi:hypothetical protein
MAPGGAPGDFDCLSMASLISAGTDASNFWVVAEAISGGGTATCWSSLMVSILGLARFSTTGALAACVFTAASGTTETLPAMLLYFTGVSGMNPLSVWANCAAPLNLSRGNIAIALLML